MRIAFLATMASHAAAAALTPRVSRKVAVIGGGSAGVVAARYLKRGGHEPTLFEAGATFGGVWAPAPTNDVVYKSLRTNLPTVVMQSPDLDFAEGLPSYVDYFAGWMRCSTLCIVPLRHLIEFVSDFESRRQHQSWDEP